MHADQTWPFAMLVPLAFWFEAWFEAMDLRSGLCELVSDGVIKVGLSSTSDAEDHSLSEIAARGVHLWIAAKSSCSSDALQPTGCTVGIRFSRVLTV
jgi:hypothetical protein